MSPSSELLKAAYNDLQPFGLQTSLGETLSPAIYTANNVPNSAKALCSVQNKRVGYVDLELGRFFRCVPSRKTENEDWSTSSTFKVDSSPYEYYKRDPKLYGEMDAVVLPRTRIYKNKSLSTFNSYQYENPKNALDLKNPCCVLEMLSHMWRSNDEDADRIIIDDLSKKATLLQMDPIMLYQAWQSETPSDHRELHHPDFDHQQIPIKRFKSTSPYVSAAFSALRGLCTAGAVSEDCKAVTLYESPSINQLSSTTVDYAYYVDHLHRLSVVSEYCFNQPE